MPTVPLTLTPAGGAPYNVLKAHLLMLARGPWVIDCDLSADSLLGVGMPSGKCVVMFGGLPFTGTIDPSSSGMFGPTGRCRVVAGGNGWSTSPAQGLDLHLDSGVTTTQVYEAIGGQVGEIVTDIAPTVLGTDYVYSNQDPASAVFGDGNWWVDPTGVTFAGPRPPAIPDPSLVIRDFDPIHQKVTFSCDTVLLPNTPLVDPRFGATVFTVWNIEQVFDEHGSTGWAWANTVANSSLVIDDLKAAVLHWTRAAQLRVYRYQLITYQGDGPGGPPARMALQAVTPSAGMPNLIPITPWSGVAGVVTTLAPSQQVLVIFENADPTLPRVIGYSLVGTGAVGLPLEVVHDAQTSMAFGQTCPAVTVDATGELDIGVMAPLVNVGEQAAAVKIAGGASPLVPAPWATGAATALSAFGNAVESAVTPPPTSLAQALTAIIAIGSAGHTLASAISALPPAATTIVTAT